MPKVANRVCPERNCSFWTSVPMYNPKLGICPKLGFMAQNHFLDLGTQVIPLAKDPRVPSPLRGVPSEPCSLLLAFFGPMNLTFLSTQQPSFS